MGISVKTGVSEEMGEDLEREGDDRKPDGNKL